MFVLKIGGNEIDQPEFLDGLSSAIRRLDGPGTIVHGGGKEIAAALHRHDLDFEVVDGMRATSPPAMTVVEQVLSGAVNKRLVARLNADGILALGLSGVDLYLLETEPLRPNGRDLGRVGEIVRVRADVLRTILDQGWLPVISPVSVDQHDHQPTNVNADHAALAIATALEADELIFVSNVPGVLIEGEIVAQLTPGDVESYIASGAISGGMVPKVRSAVNALTGVRAVRITNLAGLQAGTGTILTHRRTDAQCSFASVRLCVKKESLMNTQQLIADADHYVARTYARPSFVLEHGKGVEVWDSEGRRYLDFVAGIAVNALGHADPTVLRVMQEQAARLTHVSNLYWTEPGIEFARLLVESCFADKVFLCNSGTEAVEGALKFARKIGRLRSANKTGIVAFEHGFHGRTTGALATTHKAAYREPFEPLLPGVRFAPFNDLDAATEAINDDVCAVIVEPIQGEGGITPATDEFLRGLRALCDQHNALLIFDEIQCGGGRTGTIWAHQFTGATPDIMVAAKPLANGLPVGAVLITDAVAEQIKPGDHGSTFAGGPLVCAVAAAVFKRLSDPELLTHVQDVGDYLRSRLLELQGYDGHIVDVRGRGLMQGIQINGSAAAVKNAAQEAGLLLVPAGDDVIRFVPPLIVQRTHVDEAIGILRHALEVLN